MSRESTFARLCLFGLSIGLAIVATPALTGFADRRAPAADVPSASMLPAEEFSPALLGIYRKVMRIEADIIHYADKHGVDVTLARAVCLYESGGNPNLSSSAGAQGYFQVMPATFRRLGVPSNIEAGIKYLGQMVRQFGREDYALAAYNGGPTRVARRRPMPLESLQYVVGVSGYWSVLKAHEPSVRASAQQLTLVTVREGEDWWAISRRLNLPVVQLRLHNPFLAARTLRAGYVVAVPAEPREDVFDVAGNQPRYRTRLGDNYLMVAFILGVDLDVMRDANKLWRLEPLLAGTDLEIPVDPDAKFLSYTVSAGDEVADVASKFQTDPWSIVRDNHLWNEELLEGAVLRIRQTPPKPAIVTHVVRSGDTLTALARRYGTTIRGIQSANGLGGRTTIRIGQRLRIPRS